MTPAFFSGMTDSQNNLEKFRFEEAEGVPNNPELPALLYRRVFDATTAEGDLADTFEARYRENGWGGAWRWGVYDFHHFHSRAHEALGVSRGEARLALGGPDGRTVSVQAGDLIVLPAGTGHKNEGSSADFQVVGAYPVGQENYDLIKVGEPVDESIRQRIRETPLPERDPIFGDEGPLTVEWCK